MRLLTAQVNLFRNIVDSGPVAFDPEVTCLLGKNESGKTTFLQALHSLNPAYDAEPSLDVNRDYPRWRKTRDGREVELGTVMPIRATFELDDKETAELGEAVGVPLPENLTVTAAREYSGELHVHLDLCEGDLVATLASMPFLEGGARQAAAACRTPSELATFARDELARIPKEDRDKAKDLRAMAAAAAAAGELISAGLDGKAKEALVARLPKFFYFSDYSALKGRTDLTELLAKAKRSAAKLDEHERTALSLLRLAGAGAEELIEEDFESRMVELEAAANELSSEVFKFWTQNRDVRVSLVSDAAPVASGRKEAAIHRFLDVRLHDLRHQVTTNLEARSPGFRWFFSFVAAFSEFQNEDNLIILLDEPGRGLHARAQCDLMRYIDERVAASNQIVYSTHSSFMIPADKLERMRVVEDLMTCENQDLGTRVSGDLSAAGDDTLLPLRAALAIARDSDHGPLVAIDRSATVQAGATVEIATPPTAPPKRELHLSSGIAPEPAAPAPPPATPMGNGSEPGADRSSEE